MARAKAAGKKKARVAGGPTAPEWARSTGETLGRALRPLGPLFFLALLYLGVSYLLWLPVQRDRRARLPRERIWLPARSPQALPAWMPKGERQKLVRLGAVAEGRTVFETGLAAQLAATLEANPWVERAGPVRLRYPAALRVDGWSLREPFARVSAEGGYVVLDRKGHVLPMPASDRADPHPPGRRVSGVALPSIVGVRCPFVPAGGRVREAGVLEGLDLLAAVDEVLSQSPGPLPVVRARRDAAGAWRLFLGARNGPTIEWGFVPDGQHREDEPTFREKKAWLLQRLFECDPKRVRYIKLDVPGAPVMLRMGA